MLTSHFGLSAAILIRLLNIVFLATMLLPLDAFYCREQNQDED